MPARAALMAAHGSIWTGLLHVGEGLGGAGAGGIVAWLTYRLKRRETANAGDQAVAQAARTLTETSLALLEPVRAAAAEAQSKAEILHQKARELEQIIASLTQALTDANADRELLRAKLAAAEAKLAEIQEQLEAARRDADINGLRRPAPGSI